MTDRDPAVFQEKRSLRTNLRSRLQTLPADEIHTRSAQVLATLERLLGTLEEDGHLLPKGIMAYSPIQQEVNLQAFMPFLMKSFRVFLPRVAGSVMEPVAIGDTGDLQPGAFDILEPVDQLPAAAPGEVINFLLLPGLGFDRNCYRLGRGQGYYDRFLSSWRPPPLAIGMAFDFQILDRIPREFFDQPLDFVCTESGVLGSGKTIDREFKIGEAPIHDFLF